MPNLPNCQMIAKGTYTFGNHLAIWQILALFGIFWQLGILLILSYTIK